METEDKDLEKGIENCIAVIGMSCRFPGATTPDEFWQNLKDGVESSTVLSDEELLSGGMNPEEIKRENYVRRKPILKDSEMFDANFFGYNAREAEMMDIQQRIFLECAWEALEDSGYNPDNLDATVGVYAGAGINTYLLNSIIEHKESLSGVESYQLMISNDKDYLSTRVAYKLNLKGPAVTVQSACSTSLVALHVACQALLSGECDQALTGGVAITHPQYCGYLYEKDMILSPDGHCRAFDAEAQGTVAGSGAGVVILKRLEDALEDGDSVHAVIRGSAINNDGSGKIGYTAPSLEGQAEVISEAQAVAGVEPEDVTYIEAHGTGTVLGDPIEISALARVFGNDNVGNNCAVGSVKTNVGHLDAASGIAGFIKTVLSLKHGEIPASLHYNKPNPKIDFDSTPFYINNEHTKWRKNEDEPRVAGVSSFGIGGTNAHVIVEEAPKLENSSSKRKWYSLPLSARSSSALKQAKENLIKHIEKNPVLNLADISYTLWSGRREFGVRDCVVCDSLDSAIAELKNSLNSGAQNASLSEVAQADYADDKSTVEQFVAIWIGGSEIDWEKLFEGDDLNRISLPTYPFEHKRYSFDASVENTAGVAKSKEGSSNNSIVYMPTWKRQPLANDSDKKIDSVLVFCDEGDFAQHLIEGLKASSVQVIGVRFGDAFVQENDEPYTINYSNASDYAELLKNLGTDTPKTIIDLTSFGHASGDSEDELKRSFDSLLFLTQALGGSTSNDYRIISISDGVCDVTGTETLNPVKSGLIGPVRVLSKEYQDCSSIFIDLIQPNNEQEKDMLAKQIISEIHNESSETVVAYRGPHRWVESFEQTSINTDPTDTSSFKNKGVYLITGGTGGLGLAIAGQLSKNYQAKLVLLQRSAASSEQEARIAKLRDAGSDVLLLQADVCNEEELAKAIEEAQKQFGAIDGIVHAAGLPGGGIMQNKTIDEARRVMSPKVNGTLNLEKLIAKHGIKQLILCSSLTSYLGEFGQSDYCAANSIMDAIAGRVQRSGIEVLNINWDRWNGVGMASSDEHTPAEQVGIAEAEALKALEACKQSGLSRLLISVKDFNLRLEEEKQFHERVMAATVSSLHPRPELETAYREPTNDVEEAVAKIWQEALGIDGLGIDDDFFDLGGHSLLATQIMSRIKEQLDVDLPMAVIFDASTIAALSEEVTCEQLQNVDPDQLNELLGELEDESEENELVEDAHE